MKRKRSNKRAPEDPFAEQVASSQPTCIAEVCNILVQGNILNETEKTKTKLKSGEILQSRHETQRIAFN